MTASFRFASRLGSVRGRASILLASRGRSMRRRGFAVFVLSGAFGCHMRPAHAVQELPDEAAEAGNAGRINPETAAAEHACEDQHDVHACTQAAEWYWDDKNGHAFD